MIDSHMWINKDKRASFAIGTFGPRSLVIVGQMKQQRGVRSHNCQRFTVIIKTGRIDARDRNLKSVLLLEVKLALDQNNPLSRAMAVWRLSGKANSIPSANRTPRRLTA